ncbi:DUF3135 domain-containing protein [Thiobacter aerophilum]|uniref:DUF3135 domain-containing protein n=1 Tax=Thiobacter aerophilum TaxID=3121275 RepID=A0ABV0EDS3_9BURK
MSQRDFRFDFDEWMRLAKTDPAAFDARRQQAIEALINEAPPHIRQRLERFQWRIDVERVRCENPMQACIKLSNMMWQLVYGDRGFLWSLSLLSDPNPVAPAATAASVVSLKPPRET